jgi:hypothetical protein
MSSGWIERAGISLANLRPILPVILHPGTPVVIVAFFPGRRDAALHLVTLFGLFDSSRG